MTDLKNEGRRQKSAQPATSATPAPPATLSRPESKIVPPTPEPPLVDFSQVNHISPSDLAIAGGGRGGSKLSINIVFSQDNGKRVKLSQALFEALGSPNEVQIVANGNHLVIGSRLPNANNSFSFNKNGGTIIYSSGLAKWIIDTFSLDFTEGRVSRSYDRVQIDKQNVAGEDYTYAVINMVD